MKIGDLAKATGTQAETIRYYEAQGLLPVPARTESNYRAYGEAHVARLAFIRHCRTLDMTLGEILKLLRFKDAPEQNCEEVNGLLDEHIAHVAARIKELRRLQTELKALREQCGAAREAAACGILVGLDEASRQVRSKLSKGRGHVHGTHTKVG
ncbi:MULTISPECIES: Cd(II)/Pb(II)-responsive transcriptional regulator [Ramlibacter]|uniref:Cd(II)/Pb(II)-responsive transcriptional regulator n=1 Tax=Ramlibacter pinisoli TaxID=2682844 RepID=A0A6N8IST0_9BURK|nr:MULTISPECIES: Cd(II)/Pb(II)-responsive transcriptional regulator [Ramlibacter]MBA2964670.1 Cd(II)/Pb(II)-responsive transcriptional regulator [Ramlibacter sp. CGMCC 1.13660]MVQ29635.1 Cd(II)/Pb(II)-responsive transcriptional regulator [Ramlibacter pinisoli]